MNTGKYGSLPLVHDQYDIKGDEFLYYLYMPIKLSGTYQVVYEQRLQPFSVMIDDCIKTIISYYGNVGYYHKYLYLTVKRQYQSKECCINREGWHSDGFMTKDLNFIWSDRQPTVFNYSEFNLSQDEDWSMMDMLNQADPDNDFTFPNKTLLMLDQYCIHRVNPDIVEGVRTFFKLSVSDDKYDLEGNTRNYLLDYDWEMRPRRKERNIPQNLEN
jgi:hypothetical protein